MGNAFSNTVTPDNISGAATKMDENNPSDDANNSITDDEDDCFFESQQEIIDRPSSSKLELIKFKEELAEKREQRKKILSKFTGDVAQLKSDLAKEKARSQVISKENAALRELLKINNIEIPEEINRSEVKINDLMEIIGSMEEMSVALGELKEHNRRLRVELSETNLSLQGAYSEMANLNCQNVEAMKQIESLKEVVAASKIMIKIREEQLEKVSGQLKNKVDEIQKSLADRESRMLSTDLREEYEKQLQNIRDLRVLYEERARLAEITRRNLARELEEQKIENANEVKKCKELIEKVEGLETTINDMSETIENKDEQINMGKAETKGLQAEMSAINKLFTQMLLGYKSEHNLDKLVSRLEENHSLLAHMVSMEDTIDGSALPKLLLDIVNQVEELQPEKQTSNGEESNQSDDNDDDNSQLKSPEEIVGNLPKVWRVLLELLSQQTGNIPPNDLQSSSCYKSVDTPAGPRMVPSVSKTYIRLKDLIVEKMSLVKDMNKMKKLNTHLESRLQDQERRLCLVTSELTKTWHVVGRLRRQHHQLHTHEKILRYELQQKRKLLNEIKEEFEYCKEKWGKAREKNDKSERELKKLRSEFISRRQNTLDSLASPESGYSDGKQSEDDSEWIDESEGSDEPKQSKKKVEKVHDSSTDYNLLAEGEDPISDMHDIADLPLDIDEHQEKSSQNQASLPSKSLVDTDDLTRCDSLSENCGAEDRNSNVIISENSTSQLIGSSDKLTRSLSAPDSTVAASSSHIQDGPETLISQKEILANVKNQQGLLAKQDAGLKSMEKDCTLVINKTKAALEAGNILKETSDNILLRVDSLNQNTFLSDITSNQSHNTEDFKSSTVKTTLPQDCGESSAMFDDKSDASEAIENISTTQVLTKNNIIEDSNIRNESSSRILQKQDDNTECGIDAKNENDELGFCHMANDLHQSQNHEQDSHLKNEGDKLKKLGEICNDLLKKTKNSIETLCQMDENAKHAQENTCELVEKQDTFNVMPPTVNLKNHANSDTESVVGQTDFTEKSEEKQPGFKDKDILDNSKFKLHAAVTETCDSMSMGESSSTSEREIELISPKEILESVRKQDERLQKRDERLKKLEENCHDLLKVTKNSYDKMQTLSESIIEKSSQDSENDGLISSELEGITNADTKNYIQASSLKEESINIEKLEHLACSGGISELEYNDTENPDESVAASGKIENYPESESLVLENKEEQCASGAYEPNTLIAENFTEENGIKQAIFATKDDLDNSKFMLHVAKTEPCEFMSKGESSSTEIREAGLKSPKEILENVRKQDERLQNRDERLKTLEGTCHDLLKVTKKSFEKMQTLNESIKTFDQNIESDGLVSSELEALTNNVDSEDNNQASELKEEYTDQEIMDLAQPTSREINDLEHHDTERPNEYIAATPKLVSIAESELLLSDNTNKRDAPSDLECIHTERADESVITSPNTENIADSELIPSDKKDEQGTSNALEPNCSNRDDSKDRAVESVVDHEARFAARDERLKRLEEQTKSLVDKVNGTNSKSVKLTFKLEELHNIYGSESKDDSETEDNE